MGLLRLAGYTLKKVGLASMYRGKYFGIYRYVIERKLCALPAQDWYSCLFESQLQIA